MRRKLLPSGIGIIGEIAASSVSTGILSELVGQATKDRHKYRVRSQRCGLTMAEIIMAIGFLSIFTTGLLAIATKGFDLSKREVDMAGAYQHCEALMERYSHDSTRSTSWQNINSITAHRFPTRANSSGVQVEDRRFCYTTKVDVIGTDLKKVQVRLFVTDPSSSTATPDLKRAKGGEVLRMTNFYSKP